jgi:hypothetical protein
MLRPHGGPIARLRWSRILDGTGPYQPPVCVPGVRWVNAPAPCLLRFLPIPQAAFAIPHSAHSPFRPPPRDPRPTPCGPQVTADDADVRGWVQIGFLPADFRRFAQMKTVCLIGWFGIGAQGTKYEERSTNHNDYLTIYLCNPWTNFLAVRLRPAVAGQRWLVRGVDFPARSAFISTIR